MRRATAELARGMAREKTYARITHFTISGMICVVDVTKAWLKLKYSRTHTCLQHLNVAPESTPASLTNGLKLEPL